MSLAETGTNHSTSPQALARANNRRGKQVGRRRSGGTKGLTPRVKAAVQALICDGCNMKQAAEAGGITYRSLWDAFRKPEVQAYFKAEMEVFRSGARAGNIRAALEIREDHELRDTAAGQKVRLEACKYLDADPYQQHGGVSVHVGIAVTPGYVIDLRPEPDEGGHQIQRLRADDTKPLIEHSDVPADEAGTCQDEGE